MKAIEKTSFPNTACSGATSSPLPTSLDSDNAQHPFNFSINRKRLIVVVGIICAFNSTFGSSLPSGATTNLSQYFNIPAASTYLVLLNSLYMIGFTISPLVLAPLSESIGRRPVLVGSYTFYSLSTLCCAVAPTYTSLLIFRLIAGTSAAVPNAVVGGLYADIFANLHERGRAMALFMFTTALGPLVGPLLSGFVSMNIGWRWVFWVALIIAGVGLPIVWLLPETYVPVLESKTRVCKKKTRITKTEVYNSFKSVVEMLKRPGLMMVKEPILLFSSLYLALVYAMMYLFFQAYPIVFGGIYALSQDIIGLAYIPIMAGETAALLIFHIFSTIHTKAEQNNSAWTREAEFRRLPLACLGGFLIPSALLVLSFTATRTIHPAIPMIISGTLFGAGYLLIFLAMLIYLSDVYKRYAASAQAAASTTRSLAATCLPFAAPVMYHDLGVRWAGVVLACISALMATIPFVFLIFRGKLRARSEFAG